MRILLLATLAALASMGCHTARKVAQAVPTVDTALVSVTIVDTSAIMRAREDSARWVHGMMSKVLENRIRFETFSAKVKVDYRDSTDKSLEFNAFIRIRRDSAIWVSIVAALGVEAFRVLITPDSVHIMDKLEKTIRHAAAADLQDITQLPFDFRSLQELIVGNPIGLDTASASIRRESANAILSFESGGFRHFLTYDTTGPLLRTSRLDEIDTQRHRTAMLSFDQYLDISGRRFAGLRRMSLSDKQMIDIKLDFRQAEFDIPLSFSFSIPRNYKLK